MASLPSGHWARIDTLFEQALDRPAEERTAFLRAACGDDPALYREVEALLASVPASARLFGESAAEFAAPLLADVRHPDEADDPALGTTVGPYRIADELGRGGMGTVYLAERADGAFEKEVALKLVKRGMDTDEVLRRFHRERQILAGLDHPGIARLLDGGAAADGRPFLVMERVHGEPITAWADARRLGVEARLGLFLQVAEAVGYAHRRLVVHRDLKPSNILVTEDAEGKARVKLLDFGIARLLGDGGDGAWTQTDHRRLTPAYAAPEQVRGEPVTTATDVYALGVVLYELLTGRRPYDVQGMGLAEIERLLADPPPRPSTVLTTEAAGARRATPERLARRLRGDLDTIVLRALHPDSERRYPSVEALADDLRRHRRGERVLARPDTLGYRVRSFVRRHRVSVSAAVAVVLALVGGLGAALWQAGVAQRERDLARTEAATAEQVTDFLVRVFEVADPRQSGGERLTAEAILQQGSARIEGELAEQPAVQAALFHVVGRVYTSMGLYDEAAPFLERALALRRALHPGDHADVAASLHELAELTRLRGAYADAVTRFREALAMQRRLAGGDDRAVATTLDNLAVALHHDGQPDEAIRLHREALDLRIRLLGDRHEEVAASRNNLAGVLHGTGRLDEAEALYREALAVQRARLGPEHADVATTLNNLARLLKERGDLDAAEPLYREALAIWRTAYGDDHALVAIGVGNLGALLRARGDLDAAEPYYREALDLQRRVHGEEHAAVAAATNNLGKLLYTMGDYADAAALYRQAVALWERLYGDAYPHLAAGYLNLGDVARATGDLGEAEALYRQSLDVAQRAYPEGSPRAGQILTALGGLLTERGRAREAEPLLREALATGQAAYGEGHADTAAAQSALGACLLALGRAAEAEPLLLAGYRALAAQEDAEHRRRAAAMAAQLAALYQAQGRTAEAARYRAEAGG